MLVHAGPRWSHSRDKEMKRKIEKFSKRMSETLRQNSVEIPGNVCPKRCKTLITETVDDKTHRLHPYIRVLPRGRIGMLKCRTERFLQSVVPSAIKLLNYE